MQSLGAVLRNSCPEKKITYFEKRPWRSLFLIKSYVNVLLKTFSQMSSYCENFQEKKYVGKVPFG